MATRKPSRPALTRETVLAAALAIGDAQGLDALSLRRLAAELGVTPMSVYNYFENKDALLDAIADRVYGDVQLPDPTQADWWDGLAALARSTRAAFIAHPLAATIVTRRPVSGPNTLRIVETILALLHKAGFETESAVRVSTAFTRFLISMVAYEAGLLPELSPEQRRQQALKTRFELESLPAADYPNLITAAQYLAAPHEPDAVFEHGLDLLHAGIEAQLPS